ncbi:MAG: GAF domain-containing sensor histidine kinase [Candidatus Wallbacteria bacterium]|nr:GAF domain-containing sensor histidine kinase [Candidatus Wallbacteria bacterium]
MRTGAAASGQTKMSDRVGSDLEHLLPVLLEVARDMNSERSLERLLEYIPRVVAELTDAERCTIFLLDEERGELWSRVAMETKGEIRVKVGEGIAGHVARTGESLHIRSAYDDVRFSTKGDNLTGFVTRNVLCAPLKHLNGRILGVFQLLNKRSGDFQRRDEELLTLFGSHAAVALESARLNREKDEAIVNLTETQGRLLEQMKRLEGLYAIQTEVNASNGFEEVLSSVIRRTAEMFDSEAGSILLRSSSDNRLYFKYGYGGKAEQLQTVSISACEGVAGWVLENRRATVSNDAVDDTRFDREFTNRLGYGVRNLMAAPLVCEGEPTGVLEVLNRRDRGYDAGDLAALEFIAGQVQATLQRQVLLEESRKAQRLASVGNTASRIVHDLKNPMTVLRGMLQIFQETELPPEQLAKYASVGIREIDRSVEMMQEILDFGRGNTNFTFSHLELALLADEIVPLLERECRQKRLELTIDFPAGLAVWADPPRMKRVVFNLARNAVEALPSEGRLTLVARPQELGVLIRVADNGPGIPPEIRSRLFEAFATHGKTHGTGLGLAICKSLVEGHKGKIWVDWDHSPGTCFSLWLPAPA